ncbi:transcription initiation factor TFIID subunit 4 [Favolaschia claudopus]|uniref:Transcription initiation factor TFIID subunit 4 n=1 Tax=Favolaschia claudopus TaxID=2862362 RepID=A0AAW0DQX7_9AGAR
MSAPPQLPPELWDSCVSNAAQGSFPSVANVQPVIPMDADADTGTSDTTPTVVTTVPSTSSSTTPYLHPALVLGLLRTSAYQHYQNAYSHYQQQPSAYQTYQYASPTPAPQQQTMARQAIANSQQANSGGFDTADVATLNDAIGSAGVDLRAEEESLQRSHRTTESYGVFEDRSRKQPARPNFDVNFLGATMRTVASRHKVAAVPEDCINYLALALRARLQDLVTGMIDAARHRTRAQFDRAPGLYEDGTAAWGVLVRSDVAKQIAALETAERGEEERMRRVRERRDKAIDAALTALLNGDEDAEVNIPGDDDAMDIEENDLPKPRTEEVERRMTNEAANRAAGLIGKYAWLTGGYRSRMGDAPPPRRRRYKPSNGVTAVPPPLPLDVDHRMPVNIRDAMFVIEKERGHGGGRGAARGWT